MITNDDFCQANISTSSQASRSDAIKLGESNIMKDSAQECLTNESASNGHQQQQQSQSDKLEFNSNNFTNIGNGGGGGNDVQSNNFMRQFVESSVNFDNGGSNGGQDNTIWSMMDNNGANHSQYSLFCGKFG